MKNPLKRTKYEPDNCPRVLGQNCVDPNRPPHFSEGRGLVNSFAPGCDGCGSISGDDFMAFVREGGRVDGSDKNYKVYLEKDTGTPYETIKTVHTTPDGRTYEGHQPKQGTGVQHAKFYWMHLTREQQQEFVDLWNEKKVNHSLYVRPYFMSWDVTVAPEV